MLLASLSTAVETAGNGSFPKLSVWLFPSTAEILVDFPTLPFDAEESPDPEEYKSGDGDADAGAGHGPVKPDGAAVIGHVDREPHQAEGDPDPRTM
jgi:hypothetical protein